LILCRALACHIKIFRPIENGNFSLIERAILSAGAMLIRSKPCRDSGIWVSLCYILEINSLVPSLKPSQCTTREVYISLVETAIDLVQPHSEHGWARYRSRDATSTLDRLQSRSGMLTAVKSFDSHTMLASAHLHRRDLLVTIPRMHGASTVHTCTERGYWC
jgi:hypothetical protein